MAILKVLPRRERGGPANWLMAKARDVYSQFGEDGILEALLAKLDPPNRYCIEFGAWDGKHLSNCWRLIEQERWRGLLIEGNPIKFFDLLSNIEGVAGVQAAHAHVELEGPRSLDALAHEAGAPDDPALISIDVDGMDFHIFKSIKRLKPHVLVVEFNPTFPNNVVFVQDDNPAANHGSSARALTILAEEKGMALVAATTTNLIFVRKERLADLELETTDIDDIVDVARLETTLAELYDGTLLACGRTKMVWSAKDFGHLGLQALPPEQRVFPDSAPQPLSTWRGAIELPFLQKKRGEGRPAALLIANALRPVDDLMAPAHALWRRFDIAMAELRGGPGVQNAPGRWTLGELAEDCLRILEAAGLERPLIIGHGVGGIVAAALANTMPGALGCVCLDPPIKTADSPFFSDMLANPAAGEAGGRLRRDLLMTGEAPPADFAPLFRALDKPCVVLAASAAANELDGVPPVIADATLAELGANPHVRAHRLPDVDHLDCAEMACVGVELLGAGIVPHARTSERKIA